MKFFAPIMHYTNELTVSLQIRSFGHTQGEVDDSERALCQLKKSVSDQGKEIAKMKTEHFLL